MDSNGRPDTRALSSLSSGDICRRCGGLMVVEHYIDVQDDTGQIGLTAWRCTGCGEVIDPTILRNREKPAPNLSYGTKQRKFAQRVDQGESDGPGSRNDNGTGGAPEDN